MDKEYIQEKLENYKATRNMFGGRAPSEYLAGYGDGAIEVLEDILFDITSNMEDEEDDN